MDKSKNLFPQLSHQKKVILNTANKHSSTKSSSTSEPEYSTQSEKTLRSPTKSFSLSDFPRSTDRKKSSRNDVTREESISSNNSSESSNLSDVDEQSKSSKSSGELSSDESDDREENPSRKIRVRSSNNRR